MPLEKIVQLLDLRRYGFVSCGRPLQGLEATGILHQGAIPPLIQTAEAGMIKKEKNREIDVERAWDAQIDLQPACM